MSLASLLGGEGGGERGRKENDGAEKKFGAGVNEGVQTSVLVLGGSTAHLFEVREGARIVG